MQFERPRVVSLIYDSHLNKPQSPQRIRPAKANVFRIWNCVHIYGLRLLFAKGNVTAMKYIELRAWRPDASSYVVERRFSLWWF